MVVGETVKVHAPPPVKLNVFDSALRAAPPGPIAATSAVYVVPYDGPSQERRGHVNGDDPCRVRVRFSNGYPLEWLGGSENVEAYLVGLNDGGSAVGDVVIGGCVERRSSRVHRP